MHRYLLEHQVYMVSPTHVITYNKAMFIRINFVDYIDSIYGY